MAADPNRDTGFAMIHLALGEKDQATHFLEKTYEDRDGYNFTFIKVDPLRGDPRFEALVARIFPAQKSSTPSP
jgi:hypothetical protein